MEIKFATNASSTTSIPFVLLKFSLKELTNNKRMDSGIYLLGLIALFGWTLVILWMTRPFWTGRIKLHGNNSENLLMDETKKLTK